MIAGVGDHVSCCAFLMDCRRETSDFCFKDITMNKITGAGLELRLPSKR